MYPFTGQSFEAIAVGDVQIPVKLFPKRSGAQAHGTLHLRNVLHAPTALCYIIGGPSTGDYDNYQLGCLGDNGWDGDISKGGQRIGYLDFRVLWVLKLSGPPLGPVVGPPVIKPEGNYMIHAFWPESERRRWAEHPDNPMDIAERRRWANQPANMLNLAITKQRGGSNGEKGKERAEAAPSASSTGVDNDDHSTSPLNPALTKGAETLDPGKGKGKTGAAPSAPYTDEEKDWLKRHWGGEFKFLLAHQLSIYKDEDRDEGRRIVRAMMEAEEDDEDEDGGVGNDERALQAHAADYNFAKEELDFIERGWGSSEGFMMSFGIKFYKDEDCEEAKAIVRALMAEDEPDSDEDPDVD